MRKILILCSTITMLSALDCHALSLIPVVAVAFPTAASDPSNIFTVGSRYTYGGGVLFRFEMFSKLSLEVGALYLPRGYSESDSVVGTVVNTFDTIQFPALLKYQPFSILSLGLGPYFSHGVGSVHSYPVSDPSQTTDTAYSFSTFGADDYGMVVSAGLDIRILPLTRWVMDGRYLIGAQNISKMDGTSIYFRDLQIITGLRFGI